MSFFYFKWMLANVKKYRSLYALKQGFMHERTDGFQGCQIFWLLGDQDRNYKAKLQSKKNQNSYSVLHHIRSEKFVVWLISHLTFSKGITHKCHPAELEGKTNKGENQKKKRQMPQEIHTFRNQKNKDTNPE